MEVHAQLCISQLSLYELQSLDHVGRQAAAIRVTQHQALRSRLVGGFEDGQAELGIRSTPVEEVLRVEKHAAIVSLQVLDGLGNHGHAFVEVGPQSLAHVVVPRLADNADDLCLGFQQCVKLRVTLDIPTGASGRSEGRQRRCREFELGFGPFEELVVLRVGPRPAAFHVPNPEFVEQRGNP